MAWTNLISAIEAVITANGNNEITGTVLKDLFINNIIPQLGKDKFLGLATPSTNPGTLDNEGWYFAKSGGTYANFNGVVKPEGLHIFYFKSGVWENLTLFGLDNAPNAGSTNLMDSDSIFKANEVLKSEIENLTFNFEVSKNKINKDNNSAGYYATNGSFVSSLNWLRTGVVNVESASQYTLSGLFSISNAVARVVFYDSSDTYISHLLSDGTSNDVTFTTPLECEKIGINLANAVGIGNTPSDNVYSNLLMLQEGAIATSYESFFARLKSESLGFDILDYVTTSVFSEVQTAVNTVKDAQRNVPQFVPFSKYDGATSKSVLDTTLVLSQDGDFFEIDVEILELGTTSSPKSFGILGLRTDNNTFGFWSSGAMYLRSPDGFMTTSGFLQSVSDGDKFTVKALWHATDGIKIYKDGIFQRNVTKYNFEIKNIADANSAILGCKVNIRNLNIRANSVDLNIPVVAEYPSATHTAVILEDQTSFLTPAEKLQLYAQPTLYKETYYTLDIDGSSTGDEKFTIYQKMKDGVYAGFDVEHIVDETPDFSNPLSSAQVNYWRITSAYEYTFNGVDFTLTGNRLLAGGESESVYKTRDSQGNEHTDHTGGVHGDEIMLGAYFFASGVQIADISTDIPLTGCKDFYYAVKSNTKAFGTTTNETEHNKLTFFEKGGYRTVNVFDLIIDTYMFYWYYVITCIHDDAGTLIHNEDLDFVDGTTDDNAFKLTKNGVREYYSTNDITGISCFATGRLIEPRPYVDNGSIIYPEDSCNMTVWDRLTASNDNKMYISYRPNAILLAGTRLKSEMVVKFNKL